MLDELQLIKEMVGDLSVFGGWAFGGYIAYSLIKMAFTFGGACWLLNKLMILVFDYLKAPVTKSEHENTKREMSSLMVRVSDADRELEKVKHMYKILKDKDATNE